MARNRRIIAGRPVVITGAASGIGRSLARRLSRSGSPVAIADVDEPGLKETARSLPGPVLTRVLDVPDAADQHRFAVEVRHRLLDTRYLPLVDIEVLIDRFGRELRPDRK